jgi:hypothetical protein
MSRDVPIQEPRASLPDAAEARGLDADWRYVSDGVMGGVSEGRMTRERVAGREAVRLTGRVSTANDGGFIQIATDLAGGAPFDASGWDGVALDLAGNGEVYELRLRSAELARPWQSYRLPFRAGPGWGTLVAPFAAFAPHRTDAPFDPARLTRLGVLAIGREFAADVAVRDLRLWRQ